MPCPTQRCLLGPLRVQSWCLHLSEVHRRQLRLPRSHSQKAQACTVSPSASSLSSRTNRTSVRTRNLSSAPKARIWRYRTCCCSLTAFGRTVGYATGWRGPSLTCATLHPTPQVRRARSMRAVVLMYWQNSHLTRHEYTVRDGCQQETKAPPRWPAFHTSHMVRRAVVIRGFFRG